MDKKELVLDFIKNVFNAHDLSRLDEYMRDDYMQHSIGVADGKEGFKQFAAEFFKKEPFMDVKKVFESEDTVAVFFKCSFKGGNSAKVVDMYRVENGKIAEHWDVVQALPDDDKTSGSKRGSF